MLTLHSAFLCLLNQTLKAFLPVDLQIKSGETGKLSCWKHLSTAATSDLEADLLTGPMAAVFAARVRHDRHAFLLRGGSFPDVLQPSEAPELLGEQ